MVTNRTSRRSSRNLRLLIDLEDHCLQAYRAAQQPAEAIGEFQRILDHRSIVLVDPTDALARLQLARALVLAGDTAKAKSAYTDLLTLWKDADSEIPVLKEARAEYAQLP